jgi:hypothetical protein
VGDEAVDGCPADRGAKRRHPRRVSILAHGTTEEAPCSLNASRSGDFANEDWRYGANQDWMRDALAYWRDGFDFAGLEAALNRWDHYRVVLDGMPRCRSC